MAKMRVARGLRHSVPLAINNAYDPGDKVLVWREKIVNHRIGEWPGPFTVLGMDASKKHVYIQDVKVGAAHPLNVAQVKRYIVPMDLAHSFFVVLHRGLSHFSSPGDDDDCVHLTEVIHPNDPRATSSDLSQAKLDEIRGLLDRETFSVILREDIPPDGNVLLGPFFPAIKSAEGQVQGAERNRWRSRSHEGSNGSQCSHATAAIYSPRLLIASAAVHGFDIWSSQVH